MFRIGLNVFKVRVLFSFVCVFLIVFCLKRLLGASINGFWLLFCFLYGRLLVAFLVCWGGDVWFCYIVIQLYALGILFPILVLFVVTL